jgi:hypothetical protein
MNLQENIERIKQMMGFGKSEPSTNEEDRFTCSDCGNPDYKMYMVNDDIWNEYGNDRNTLCKSCLENRMGRELVGDDFAQYKYAPVNQHNPEVQSLM